MPTNLNRITGMVIGLTVLVVFTIACQDDRFAGWLLTGMFGG